MPTENAPVKSETLDDVIMIRCSTATKRRLERKAKARRLPVSTWLRNLGEDAPAKPAPTT